jgi:hypothetical protein
VNEKDLEISRELAELKTDVKHILLKIDDLVAISEFSLFKKIVLSAIGAIASVVLMLVKKVGL